MLDITDLGLGEVHQPSVLIQEIMPTCAATICEEAHQGQH